MSLSLFIVVAVVVIDVFVDYGIILQVVVVAEGVVRYKLYSKRWSLLEGSGSMTGTFSHEPIPDLDFKIQLVKM